MSLWAAREAVHHSLCDVPELLRTNHVRLRKMAFDIALDLHEAKLLRDPPLSRWEHLKAALRVRVA